MRIFRLPVLIASTFLVTVSFSTPLEVVSSNEMAGVNWMSWQEAEQHATVEKRKFMVDLYTDWCGWCKKMDAATFQQSYISNYINEHYYPVKFNAEMKEDVVYQGKTYSFVSNGNRGYHALAAEITRGRLGYPTVVFLDENMEVIQAISGYRGPDEFERILAYFADDFHKKIPWEKFEQSYGNSVPAIPKD